MSFCGFALELLGLCGSFESAGGSLSGRDYGRDGVEVPGAYEALMFHRGVREAFCEIEFALL